MSIFLEVRWCSGYHVCFTRRRSRVQASLEPFFFLFFFFCSSPAIAWRTIFGRWESLHLRCSVAWHRSTGNERRKRGIQWRQIDHHRLTIRDNDEEIIGNVMSKPIDFNLLPKISAECRAALMSMLERDPNKRISASDLLQHPWIRVSDCRDREDRTLI